MQDDSFDDENNSNTSNSSKGQQSPKLIVNYIPQAITENDLEKIFEPIGKIESIKIMKDKLGNSFGFGFVNYVTLADAARAIETLNGYNLLNKKLKVSYARPQGVDRKDTNLYITNLPVDVSDQMLEKIFGKYGQIVQKNILKDKDTGKPKGVAFVRFSKREEAHAAISDLDGKTLDKSSTPLNVRPADFYGKQKVHYLKHLEEREYNKDANLYVSNLPKSITQQELYDLFCEYGEIVQYKLLKDKTTGVPTGVAFVRYAYPEEAQYAIEYLDGIDYKNAALPLIVRVAEVYGKQTVQNLTQSEPKEPEEILIEAVYIRRALWEPALQSQNTEENVEKLWQEIAAKFNYEYSLEFLIKKWRELKQSYSEERHRQSVYRPGVAPSSPTFYYYDIMKFLDGEPTDFQRFAQKRKMPTVPSQDNFKMRRMIPPAGFCSMAPTDDVDDFLKTIGEILRKIPKEPRIAVQLKILDLVEANQSSDKI